MKAPRELILPGPAAPHWLPSGEPPGGLLYLAWGRRHYGTHPIPQRLHHGWTTMVVLSGEPVFLAGERNTKVGRGALIVAGPDVPYGWSSETRGECSLLVWEWSRSPQFASPLHTRTCWMRSADPDTLSQLENLHDRTRREVQRPDTRSPRALSAIQDLLDVALERSGSGQGNQEAREAQRLQLAEQWMRRHLDVRAPAGALADYLGMSPMGLQRLFRQSVGISPGRAFHQLRMREANALLARPGASVKSVALGLGYRHPGDFTRAFTRFHGHPPSVAPRKAQR